MRPHFRPLLMAGAFLGVGLGGFLDGILLHQLLQTHNMLSGKLFPDTVVNIEINMFWDGLFHAFTWIVTAIGVGKLWQASGMKDVPRSTGALMGSMILGWGLFNAVEGSVDHLLLGVHHVIERAPMPQQLYYDIAFVVFGLYQMIFGWALIKKAKKTYLHSQEVRHETFPGTQGTRSGI